MRLIGWLPEFLSFARGLAAVLPLFPKGDLMFSDLVIAQPVLDCAIDWLSSRLLDVIWSFVDIFIKLLLCSSPFLCVRYNCPRRYGIRRNFQFLHQGSNRLMLLLGSINSSQTQKMWIAWGLGNEREIKNYYELKEKEKRWVWMMMKRLLLRLANGKEGEKGRQKLFCLSLSLSLQIFLNYVEGSKKML